MLKIWGRRNSINVQKVMWTVEEIDLKHERIDAGMAFGRNREPEFLKMNPNGLVPVLQDGDLTLWESNAIVRYLAARYSEGNLWSKDPAHRAESDKWMDWMTVTINVAIAPVFTGLVRTPPEQRDAKAIEAARLKSIDLIKIFDAHLANRPFVAGATLTMGDIPMGCFANRWYALPIERPSTPNIAAYLERLKQRPAFAANVASVPLT